jgi:hypothetical protein
VVQTGQGDLVVAPFQRHDAPSQHNPGILPRPASGVAVSGLGLVETAELFQGKPEIVKGSGLRHAGV